MCNDRKVLPAGTEIITTQGIRYKIISEIGGGGTSIIYETSRSESNRKFVLKECYPVSKYYNFVREKGVVKLENLDADAVDFFNIVKENMLRENEIGQIIANKTGRTVSSWGKLNVSEIVIDGKNFAASESLFIVMEQTTDNKKQRGWFLKDLLEECAKVPDEKFPLRNGGNASPMVATNIIEELLKSLRDIHRAGYIHGDINDANFFLMGQDIKSGDIGVGQLIDFGNTKKILSNGKTEPLKKFFSTPGYKAPELKEVDIVDIELTQALDIYAVGCLMMYLFYGMNFRDACKDDSMQFKKKYLPSKGEVLRHGYRRDTADFFRKILSKALDVNPAKRYQNGEEMLQDIFKLKTILRPPKFLLAQNLSRSEYFVDGSRDKEINTLQIEMAKGKNPLFIYGIGGIGKTELAMEFARRQIENGMPAYLVTFRGNIKETVRSLNFSGYDFELDGGGNADTDYYKRLEILREDYRDCLLIVDNFDDAEKNISQLQNEVAYTELVEKSGMKILFTTRSRPDKITKELMPFDEETAWKLFNSISPVSEKDVEIVRELIREVDFHPMTIELLAKTREDSWRVIPYRELLARIRHGHIDAENFPNVQIKKNGMNDREAKIYGHLVTLFNLYNLGTNYRKILCHTTLLPQDGFDAAIFISHEDNEKILQLKNLESHSWIRRHKETNLLWIHPLIRTIFKNELKPADEDCADFLAALWNLFDNMYPPNFNLFKQAAEMFGNATNELPDNRGDFAFYAGFCCLAVGNYSLASIHEDKAVKRREKVLINNPRELARTYNDAGVAALQLNDFDKGLAYLEQTIKILTTLTDIEDLQNLANVCSNVATAYNNRENVERGMILARRAVDIFEKYPPKNLYEKANAHNSLAQSLKMLKRYEEALSQLENALSIMKDLAPDHPDLAVEYRYIAEVLVLSNEIKKSLPYAKEAIKIFEKTLPPNHSEIIKSYSLISEIYRLLGDNDTCKFYIDKVKSAMNDNQENLAKKKLNLALKILEDDFFKPTINDIIKYNREATEACRILKKLDDAQKFIMTAVENIQPDTDEREKYLVYFTASQIFSAQKDFETAIMFAKKSLENSTSDELSTTYLHLGNLYSTVGTHEEALKNFLRAVDEYLKSPVPDVSAVISAKRMAGIELLSMKKFNDAEKILKEVLEEQLKLFPEFHREVQFTKKLLNDAIKFSTSAS